MKRTTALLIVTLLALAVSVNSVLAAGTQEAKGASLAGQTLTFLTIQPHNVAAANLAKWFEEKTAAKVELVVVPYDNVTEKAVLDITSGATRQLTDHHGLESSPAWSPRSPTRRPSPSKRRSAPPPTWTRRCGSASTGRSARSSSRS